MREKLLESKTSGSPTFHSRIHDLSVLLDAVLVVEPLWEFMRFSNYAFFQPTLLSIVILDSLQTGHIKTGICDL